MTMAILDAPSEVLRSDTDLPSPPTDREPADHAGPLPRRAVDKVHLASHQRRKTLATVLTVGQAADSPQFTTVLGRIRVPRR